MSKITVISKLTHVETVTDGSQVTLNDSSIVKINAERADILEYNRNGNDLIIKLVDGETITVKNFYVSGDQGISQLVLEENNGALWWIADPMAGESYQSIASIDALLAGTTASTSEGAAIWPWALGGVAVAGGIALAAGGGGGGGGGGSDSDGGNNNGGGGDNGNGNGGNPTLPGTDPNDTTPPGAAGNLRFSADGTKLSGSAEANSIITVTDANGNVIGRGQTNGNGEFTVDLGKPYTNGETVTVTPTDGAGNVGPGTPVTAADTTPPVAPVVASVTDDVGSVTGSLTSGQTTDDARPTFSGSGEPGSTITIYDNGNAIGTAQVNTDGSWTFTPATALGDGAHQITTRATDSAGNTGPASPAFSLTVDTVAPNAPSGVTVNDTTGSVQGQLTAGQSTDANRPSLNSTGEAGSTIRIYDNGQLVGQATVGEDGKWSFTPDNPLADGPHAITLTETDLAGNTSAASEPFAFTIDRTPPALPTISLIPGGTEVIGTAEPGSTITITNGSGETIGTGLTDANGEFRVELSEAQTEGNTLNVVATDAAGNASQPANVVVGDVTPPLAPTDLAISEDGSSVTGRAEAGSTVTIRDGDDVIGRGVADADGNFDIILSTPRLNGEELAVTATDAAGNTGPENTVTAPDVTPPEAPVITSVVDNEDDITGVVLDGQVTNDTHPVISGTGEPGTTIYIYSGEDQVGFAEVDAEGNWSTELLLVDDGGYVLRAEAVDRYNNHSQPSNTWSIIVDATAPDAPAITQVINDLPDSAGVITNNSTTNDNRPTLYGTGEAGSTISIRVDGVEVGTAQVGNGGEWSFTPATALEDGPHDIRVVAKDAAGNSSAESGAFTLTVDTTAPEVPVITRVEDNTGSVQGDVTNNVPTDETRPVIHGTGPANSQISLYEGTTLLGTVTTNGDGVWSLQLATPLVNGTHAIVATVTDAVGNTSTSESFNLVVDTLAPGTPALPTITVNPDGGEQQPLSPGGSTRDTTPTLSGTGTEGDVVTIYNGTTPIGETTVQPDGTWTWTPPDGLPNGTYDLSLTVTNKDGAGNESAPSQSVSITIDTEAPDQPAAPVITDNVSEITGPVGNNGATNDTRPVISGTGTPDDIISIYDQTAAGNVKVGEAVVDVNGNWSWRPADELAQGQHSFTVTATDEAGNVSVVSNTVTVTVDSQIPAIPTIGSVDDNAGPVTGNIPAGSSSNGNTPTVTGTGENGTTVILYSNGVEVGRGLVTNGSWSITTPELKDGPTTLTVAAVDAAGNVSGQGSDFAFTVDTVPPGIPQLLEISNSTLADGTLYVNNATPTLSGSGEPLSTITVFIDGNSVGQVQANAQGQWTLPLPEGTVLANDNHTITVVASDAAGNTSESTPVSVVVDTLPPADPVVTGIVSGGTPLNGTAEAGATVTVTGPGGVVLGTGVANEQGEFSVALTPPQSDAVTLSVTASDPAGNVSDPVDFDVPATPPLPAVPVINEILDDNGTAGDVNVKGGSSNDTTPTLTGTAIAGSLVTIYLDGSATPLGTVTADAETGAWTFPIETALSAGNHSFTVTATVGAETSGQSPGATVNIDLTAPTAPAFGTVIDDVGTVSGAIVSGRATDDDLPTFNGTATPGDVITLYSGDTVLGTATVGNTGAWSITLAQPLDDDTYSLTLTATDPAGNESPRSAPFSLVVDTTAGEVLITGANDNADPVSGNVADGGSTNDNTPTLTGTAEAGSSVAIYDGIKLLGTVTASAQGTWTFTPTSVLAEGQHVFTAVATDSAGNVTPVSGTYTLTVDMTPPATPAIVSINDDVEGSTGLLTNGQVTNDTRPELTGTGVAGSTVHILDNGQEIGTALVSSTGNWSFTPASDLAPGPHDLRVSATDAAGNVSGTSPVFTINIDTAAPLAPVLLTAVDDVGATTSTLASGDTTNDARPTFTGSGEVGATIHIIVDEQEIGTAVVNAAGSWTFTPEAPLGEGTRSIRFTATDTAGNTGAASEPFILTVDTVAPAAPTLTAISDNVGPIQTPIATSGQATDDTTPTLTGRAEANATVTIYDNGVALDTVQANEAGDWTYTPAEALSSGSHTFTTRAADAAGNLSELSPGFTLIVDTLKPVAPTIALAQDDVGPVTGSLTSGSSTNDNLPVLTGTSEPNARVQIFEGDTLLAEGVADASGNWSIPLTEALSDDQHTFTAVAIDAAGNASDPSATFILTVDTVTPEAPVLVSVTDDVGTTVVLDNGQLTNDANPTLRGTAEAGSTVSVYDGTTLLGTALVGADNAWIFTPLSPLGDGEHTLTVTTTDAAGNVSPPTGGFVINVDATAPVAPAIVSIVDDTGSVQGPVLSGAPTNDTRPTLNGTAEAGAIVRIYDGDTLVGETIANGEGQWTLTQTTTTLTDGVHNFTATATDPAGNISPASPVTSITVDTIAPGAPGSFTILNNGNTLTGQGEAGSTITVRDGDTVVGTGVVNDDGSFSLTLTTPKLNGELLTVTATDIAGNTGAEGQVTAPDTTPPAVPVITDVVDNVTDFTGTVNDGQTTNDNTPLVRGTGVANATILLYSGTELIGTTQVSAGGTWEIQLTAPLPDGGHVLTAQSADAAGNNSAPSNSWSIVVDATAPDAPVITQAINDLSGTPVAIGNNTATNDTQPTLSGTGEAGTTLSIRVDGVEVGTTQVGAGGEWTFTPEDPLGEGLRVITVVAKDAAGNTGEPSVAFNITIDTVPPVAPVITLAEDTTGTVTGDVVSDQPTDETQPLIRGTGPANSQINLYEGTTLLGTATTSATGAWSIQLATPLGNGTHALTATVTDAAGNTATSGTFNLVIDNVPPATPDIPAITVNPDGGGETTLTGGGSTRDTTPTLSGTGNEGDIVTIYNGTDPIGQTTVQPGGTWTWTPPDGLPNGTYDLSLTVTNSDGAGNQSAPSQPISITIDTEAPDAPELPVVTDNVSDITGPVDNNGATNDTRPVLSGTGTPDDVITIYDQTTAGNLAVGEVVVDINGNWTWRPDLPLSEGSHSFTLTATDPAGNESPVSGAMTVTVDSLVPDIPVISSVNDNVGPVTGNVTANGSSNDNTPTVTGTGENGTTVILYSNGIEVGRGLVSGGTWTITSTALRDGPTTLTVAALDAAGNRSEAGSNFAFTLDTVPPAIPQLLDISDSTLAGGQLYANSSTPTLSGTGEPLSTISVYADNTLIGEVQTNAQGQWTLPVPAGTPLTDNPHTLTLVASDAAGNTSQSTPVNVIIDTQAPGVPVVTGIVSGGTPLNGTAEAGSTITVTGPGGAVLGTGVTNAQGQFSIALTPPQSDAVTLSLTASDVAGNTSLPGSYDVPATPALPDVPVIDAIVDDNGTGGGVNVKGLSSNDATPTLTGTAIPGSLVSVYLDGSTTPLGTVTADATTGAWSFPITTALAEGNHSFSVTATVGAETSGQSPGATVNIDLTPPAAPTLGSLVDNVGTVTGSVVSGTPTNDNQPTLNGTATPGDVITIYSGDTVLGTVPVSATGAWSFTPPAALDDGTYTLLITATDPAGNQSPPSAPFSLVVDTVTATPVITGANDDVGPVTGNVASGGVTNDNTPTLSGSAEAGSSVSIYEGTRLLGTVVANDSGIWSFTPTVVLAEGLHSFTAIATDVAGNVSTASGAYTLTVDMTPPATPVLVSVNDDVAGNTGVLVSGQLTNDARPELIGTGVAGSTVHILDNGQEIGTVLVDDTGNWRFTPTSDLAQGPHELRISATDAAGNLSGTSPAFSLTVDTVAPLAPVLATVVDDVGTVTGPVNNGGVTNDTRPTFNGTGEAGSIVSILVDGQAIGTAVVNASGSWTFTPDTALAEGLRSVTLTATDPAGNTGPASAAFTLTVDTTAPTAPTIVAAADNVGSIQTPITVSGQVTDDATPTLTGRAAASATVTLYDNGVLLGTVQASAAGDWTFTPENALGNGSHTFTASATDAAGNLSEASAGFTLIVDTVKPLAPVITLAQDDVGTVTGSLISGQRTDDTLPVLTGTSEANARVQVFEGDTLLGTATADASGNWTLPLTTPLTNATHNFTAVATDAAGNVSDPSSTFSLTVDTLPPAVPVLVSVVDDVGTVTTLTSGQLTNDAKPTLSGTAEAGSTVSIYDGALLLGSVVADANSAWSFTPPNPLADGLHSLTVTATDAVGNVSLATAGFTVNVDATAPTAPVITSVVDDVGTIQGPVLNGNPTNDTRLTLNGTAEANSVVRIYDGTTLVGEVTANAQGQWTLAQTTTTLTDGVHNFTATATDAAGNLSAASPVTAITVDTIAPGAPGGFSVLESGGRVNGTAEAGSTVTILGTDNVTVLGSGVADASGRFSIALTTPQVNAELLHVFATDRAGNAGLTVDLRMPYSVIPTAPVITSVNDNVGSIIGNLLNGQSTDDTTPTLTGTAQPLSTITLYDNNVLLATVTTNAAGVWTYTPTVPLGNGSHAFTATAGNAVGTSPVTPLSTVIVDTVAPGTPQGTFNADGSVLSGTAEAGSTITLLLSDNSVVTTTANAQGGWSYTFLDKQSEGERITLSATDAAGNTSATGTVIAPNLPLSASDNVVGLALTTNATTSTAQYSDYGVQLVGGVGNVLSLLGDNSAQVTFTVPTGGSADMEINASATGIVLSLLNTLEIIVQRWNGTTWTTEVDTGLPQFANLLTLGASGVTLNLTGMQGGQYRVLSYNSNLLATGSYTSLDVDVVQTTAGTLSGSLVTSGNVITDTDPVSGSDSAPNGTVVTSITNASGVTVNVAAGAAGTTINGLYGTLTLHADGSYTYTLTNTSASVLGRTDTFTYNIAGKGATDDARLVITLGENTVRNSVTAVDDTASLTFGTEVHAIDYGPSSQGGFTVVGVNLGNVLNLNLLDDRSESVKYSVAEGTTRTMTIQSTVGGVALASVFDLYIYKFNPATQSYERMRTEAGWLRAPLLGGSSAPLTLTLPAGDYIFLLNTVSGITALTGYRLNVLEDHVYAVTSTTAATTGDVLQSDIVPAGTHVTQVNGVDVNATGTTRIDGQYGTLLIDADGKYTYTLRAGVGADLISTPDTFVYTVTAPNGDKDTASLNITPTPVALDAVNDVSREMVVDATPQVAAYRDDTVGVATWNAALLASTSGRGSGTFEVAANTALHDVVLHFNVASLLSLGGLNVTWTITGAGVTRSGSFNGGLLLGGTATINLPDLDLNAGTYTLSFTGSMGPLGVGQISITPYVTGTTLYLNNELTTAGHTVTGNIFDGTDSLGVLDQVHSVDSRLSITGYNGTTTTLDPYTTATATATVQGHYGVLTIGVDGNYTYALNSGVSLASMTSKETFTYKLTGDNGTSDTATLTINMAPKFVSSEHNDTFTGSAYGDTLIYEVLNNTAGNGTAGNGGNDHWTNFSLAQGDKIDISDLLVGWNGDNATLGNYLHVTNSNGNTVISVDRDGAANTYTNTTLVTLDNVQTTYEELVNQNHIITG
ncbi:BapA prefix-like domain-containing protein [Enterobacter sp. MF024]|uniref:BapA/Bap/LapF family large adhesin n=1 Tax=Enterobacter sp. MF024 TaxID=2555644 RepID=UPI001106E54F|nr:BapA/Bap/LapF family large adhesin [Enterobacter sp. MF024]TLU61264.1 BapA prefix-like domain-containing protein [Enterobacter sp. MF024]